MEIFNSNKTVEEYYNAIQSAISAYDSKLADVGKDILSKAAVSAFESIDAKGDASLAGQQALSNIIEEYKKMVKVIEASNNSMKDQVEELSNVNINIKKEIENNKSITQLLSLKKRDLL